MPTRRHSRRRPARPGTRGAPADLRDARAWMPSIGRAHRPDSRMRARRTAGWSHGARAAAAAPNLDADVTGTRPPSRSTFLERPLTRNTPAREAVLAGLSEESEGGAGRGGASGSEGVTGVGVVLS